MQHGRTSGGADSGDEVKNWIAKTLEEGEGGWVGSILTNSTKMPSTTDAGGSHTSADSMLGLGSTMKIASGSVVMVESDSVSSVGSGIPAAGMVDAWLGCGSGVGLAMYSSTGQMVNGELFCTSTHSTYSANLPRGQSTGRHAFAPSLSPL